MVKFYKISLKHLFINKVERYIFFNCSRKIMIYVFYF